jgi:hypothetical protein
MKNSKKYVNPHTLFGLHCWPDACAWNFQRCSLQMIQMISGEDCVLVETSGTLVDHLELEKFTMKSGTDL